MPLPKKNLLLVQQKIRPHVQAICNSYSEIFFLKNPVVGSVLFVTTLFNPNVAVAGVISVIAAYLFARFIQMDWDFLNSGFYTYNPLLVGLAIGYLFKISPLTIFFIVVAGIFTFVFTILLFNLFSYYLRLPILSLPFALVSSVTYLASSKYSNLFVTGLYPHTDFSATLEQAMPVWLAGFLKTLGAIFFLPTVIPGIIFLITLFCTSRILFLLAVAGYYLGTMITGSFTGSFELAFSDINHFNYILIAIAVGGIFLIPSPRSYALSLIAVATATIFLESVKVFWSYYGIPAFTLPFNIVSLTFIYVFGLVRYPLVARFIKDTPEETLDYYLSNLKRFRGTERTLWLPFSGKWTVWQGFEGKWTHQGSWKHAYDFIILDDQGKSHKNKGLDVTDYYAFRKPVLAPVRGRVLTVVNNLPDNPIGRVDKAHTWGNLVVIRDERGHIVEISHFSHQSIQVNEGDWVERGAPLGLSGNSGYSPQPHIHIQVQATEKVGSLTLPFSFVSYRSKDIFYANDLPGENQGVEPLYQDKRQDVRTSFMLDDRYTFEVFRAGDKIDEISLVVRSAADGTFYFDSGRGRLYFGKFEGTFYVYHLEGDDRYLELIFLALPRLPLGYGENLTWEDTVPVGIAVKGIRKIATRFFSSFYHDLARMKSTLTYTEADKVAGTISSNLFNMEKKTLVELDEHLGFKTIRVDDLELRKVPSETVRNS